MAKKLGPALRWFELIGLRESKILMDGFHRLRVERVLDQKTRCGEALSSESYLSWADRDR